MADFYDMNAAIQKPNIVNALREGQQYGMKLAQQQRQITDQNALRDLAPKIIAGDPAAFSQGAAIDPKQAGQYQQAGDSQFIKLKGAINYFDEGLKTGDDRLIQARYKEISPYLSNFLGKPVPEMHTPDMLPAFEQLKTRIAMAGGGAKSDLPSEIQTLQMLQSNPDLLAINDRFRGTKSFREVINADGTKSFVALDNRAGTGSNTPVSGLPQAGGMGAGPTPESTLAPPLDASAVQSDYRNIGARNGFSITSMARPVMPGVGAGERSQHPKGTAVDYSVAGKSRQEIDGLMADLRAAGYEVIDESDGTTGTGPHIHAELPPNRGANAGTPAASPQPTQAAMGYGQTDAQRASAAAQEAIAVARGKADVELSTAPMIAGATEGAKLDAKLSRADQLAAADANRQRQIDEAKAQAEKNAARPGLDASYNLYRVARDGLARALKGARTGPVVGAIPAISAEDQNADSAVAPMAPVLKQLFRSAGEGVFTDKDQEMLLAMVPTRRMLPDARDEAFRRIDAIVEAKLQGGGGTQSGGKYRIGQEIEINGKRYIVEGGDMNDPEVKEIP